MIGEKFNQSFETTLNQNDDFKYPPFDLEKAKEQVAKAHILSSAEEIFDDELRQRVLNREEELKRRQERAERDEKIASLADEAEARLGRNLSQEELQDLAESYDTWLKNLNKESEQSPEEERNKMGVNFAPIKLPNETEVNIEGERNIESLSENEVRNVIGLLDTSELNVDQIVMISRGSRSSEESATTLKRMFQNMTERSNAMLSELQNGRNLGKLEAFESVYEGDMGKSFDYSMQALKNLREKARMLPGQMAGGFVFQLQQVENNLLAINNLVTRKHNLNTRDKNPTISKEKLVADEREAEDYVDKSRFGY